MTPRKFKAIREQSGLSIDAMAEVLWLSDGRSIRRYEDGTRAISGPISLLMLAIEAGYLADLQAVKGEVR